MCASVVPLTNRRTHLTATAELSSHAACRGSGPAGVCQEGEHQDTGGSPGRGPPGEVHCLLKMVARLLLACWLVLACNSPPQAATTCKPWLPAGQAAKPGVPGICATQCPSAGLALLGAWMTVKQYLCAELPVLCGVVAGLPVGKGDALPGCRMRQVDVKDILDALQLKHDQNTERPAHSM